MTEVTLEMSGISNYTVKCDGHATGSEKVCAAVSTLVYTLYNWIVNTPSVTLVKSIIEPGNFVVCFCGGGEDTRTAFDVISVGFLSLEKTYPEYIKIKKVCI